MREIGQILQLWEEAGRSTEPAVLATVVRTQGSSYRLPGARLLQLRDGRRAGTISGGCLEGDLAAKGWWLTEAGPVVRRYETNAEGEIGAGGFGLGCNGVIDVLIERLTPGESSILDVLAQVRANREPAAVCHFLSPERLVGSRLVVSRGRQAAADFSPPNVDAVETFTREIFDSGNSVNAALGDLQIFVETLAPPPRLLIFGAGHDAVPLSEMASYLGWPVRIYDGRSSQARANRFPTAEQVVVRRPGGGPPLSIDSWTVAVLMTHSYSQDLDVLREWAGSPLPRYLGILGPRARTVQLFADAGLSFEQFGGLLHVPMGLDIGADGPEQVALAVIAEIQAVLNRREGGLLRERSGSIHAKEQRMGSTICA